jgi:hypothetical protein
MSRFVAALLLTFAAAASSAQEVCPMEMDVSPMTLSEIYAKAEKIAKGWQADAVPANIGNTSQGPLDAEGKSEAWNLMFYSAAADAKASFSTFSGMFTCYAQDGPAGRIPDLAPNFFRDGAKLYAIAKEKGGSFIAQGYQVSIQTTAAPSTRHAMWYITYSNADRTNADRTVIIDANTGQVEKVLD